MKQLTRQIVAGLFVGTLVTVPAMLAAQNVKVPSLNQMPDLIGGLRSTPGCLGVETAMTASGKQVIFAWFESKEAVSNWYYSDTHLKAMAMVGAGPASEGPLAGVTDEGPVLAIASVTMAKPTGDKDASTAVSQIAIELYRPLPGGAAMGGRFAPASLKVPGLREAPIGAPATGK